MELKTVVVVDDAHLMHKAIRRMLRPVRVEGTTEAKEAVSLVRRMQPELALVDLVLPWSSGLEVVQALRAEAPTVVIGIISGCLTLENAAECIDAGASWFLEKPFSGEQLRGKIAAGGSPLRLPSPDDEIMSLESAKFRHIDRTLTFAKGNKSLAARILGIKRESLQRMLKRRPTASNDASVTLPETTPVNGSDSR